MQSIGGSRRGRRSSSRSEIWPERDLGTHGATSGRRDGRSRKPTMALPAPSAPGPALRSAGRRQPDVGVHPFTARRGASTTPGRDGESDGGSLAATPSAASVPSPPWVSLTSPRRVAWVPRRSRSTSSSRVAFASTARCHGSPRRRKRTSSSPARRSTMAGRCWSPSRPTARASRSARRSRWPLSRHHARPQITLRDVEVDDSDLLGGTGDRHPLARRRGRDRRPGDLGTGTRPGSRGTCSPGRSLAGSG